jgi:hypothetical protein
MYAHMRLFRAHYTNALEKRDLYLIRGSIDDARILVNNTDLFNTKYITVGLSALTNKFDDRIKRIIQQNAD